MSGQDVKKYDLSKFYKFSLQDVNDIEAFLTVGSFFLFGLYSCTQFYQEMWVYAILNWVKRVHIQSFSGPYFPAFGLEKLRMRTLFRSARKALEPCQEFTMESF